MNDRLRALTSQFAVVDAMSGAMLNAIANGSEPEVDVAAAIDRHGVDPLAELLTGLIVIMTEKVAAHRGDTSPAAIVDEYIRELFDLHPDELRDLVARQVHHRSRPPIGDIERQEAFLWALAAIHVRAVIDAPTPTPGAAATPTGPLAVPVRTALEYRPHIRGPLPAAPKGRSEIFEHACTPDCVPAHEHPAWGAVGWPKRSDAAARPAKAPSGDAGEADAT